MLQPRQDSASSPVCGRADEPGKKAAPTPGTPTTRAALRRQQAAAAAALGKSGSCGSGGGGIQLVDASEFSSLPAWCNRQLTLDDLNRALEGISKAVATR